TWDVDFRLTHWVGFILWAVLVILAHRVIIKYAPEGDAYIFPAAALLSGWGMLTIWRLDEYFGIRQTIWFGMSILVLVLALRFFPKISFLRKYKYLFLTSGLIITALTL